MNYIDSLVDDLIKVRNRVKRKERKNTLLRLILQAKSEGCAKCGSLYDLTFHHLDSGSKRFNVSEMVARNATITQLMLEMGKCKILCRQCHDAAHR